MKCSAVRFFFATSLSFLPVVSIAGCAASRDSSGGDRDSLGPPDAAAAGVPIDAFEDVEAATPPAELQPYAAPTAIPASASCPSDMVEVVGSYCPDVRQSCLRWLDGPGPYEHFRCAAYGKPQCVSAERTPMRFCIDRLEATSAGEALPMVHQSWTSAGNVCAAQGKRLCMESEWQFACEGEEMRPYPYGFERDASACNIDRSNLGRPNAGLRDLRTPAGSHPRCASPFGVLDMSGNVEEWATPDRPTDPRDRSTMKGAWWLPGRNTCRAATTGHGETYEGSQVGVRCCSDPSRG